MVFPKNEKYNLQCEWADCRQMHEDMDEFYKHLDEHFWTDIAAVPMEPGCTLICRWCECNFVTTNGHDLIRHLYFHGFHTKLKWLGFLKHEEAKSGECQVHQNRNIIPELPDGFKCCWEECFIVVDIPDKFYDHVRDHAAIADPENLSNGKKGFKCHWEGCSYEYSVDAKAVSLGRHKLRGHMITHTQERCYACPWCGNLYVNKTKLIDHYTRQINVENHSFQCTHCSRTFASERILKDHMRHHVNHYQCPKCAMTCPNPSALKHHIRYKHSTERPYACEFCDYRSKEPHDLQTHMQFHQSDLSYHCQVADCDYVVRSLQNLRYHYRVKHGSGDGKYYACHKCDKKYGTGYQLTHHLRKVHNFQWPPGHCRFRYKECEDGMFRLQIFRYESRELTKQLEREETSNTDTDVESTIDASTSAHIKPNGNSAPKMNIERRKKGIVTRKTRGVSERNLRSIARQVKKTACVATRKSPRKGKKKTTNNVPAKKNSKIVNRKGNTEKPVAEDILDSLPDLYINTECLEAADTLCNLKSNSAKKRKMGGKEYEINADMLLADSCGGSSEASRSNIAELPSELSLLLDSVLSPQQTPMMETRSVGVTTRSCSSKKSTPSKRRFVRARKKLLLNTDPTQNAVSPKKIYHIDGAPSLKKCSVDLVPLGNPVFPNHHKLYCNQILTKSNQTKKLPVDLHDLLQAHNLCLEGSSGSLLYALNEDYPSLGLTPIPIGDSVGNNHPQNTTETIITTIQSPHFDNMDLLTGETAESQKIVVSMPDGNNLDSVTSDDVLRCRNEGGKLVEVNSSEIVTDEDGNRTVVNVGEEEYYLVSGTDTKSGGTVYCLVKSSEFCEVDK